MSKREKKSPTDAGGLGDAVLGMVICHTNRTSGAGFDL